MKTIKQLLETSLNTVFRDQQSFWTMMLLSGGVSLIAMIVFYSYGYDINNQLDINRMIEEIWPFVIFMLVVSLFGGLLGFFGIAILTKNFQNKSDSIPTAFSEWRKIFPYIGTMFCFILGYLGIYIIFVVAAGIVVLIGFLLYELINSFGLDESTILIYNIGGMVLGVVICIILLAIFIWSFVLFFTFALPAFFLDDIKYFNSLVKSQKLLSGRWWSTIGKIFIAGLLFLFLPKIILQIVLSYGGLGGSTLFLFNCAALAIQSISSLLFLAYLFALYQDLDTSPVKS